MAYDEKLVERIREVIIGMPGLSERKMFGGLCFSVNEYMACGVQKKDLVIRVGPQNYDRALSRKHTRPMDFTGKPMTGYVYVSESGYKRKADLERWVSQGIEFVRTLPPKKPKNKKIRKTQPPSRRVVRGQEAANTKIR